MDSLNSMLCLNEKCSTTRNLSTEKPLIESHPDDKFETVLFLPEVEGRKAEGGLRTKGYFKKSLPDKLLVTVITVVFNGEKYLEQTIESVINQSYDNIEYIIIDGGSTDNTLGIIRQYEKVIDYWISEPDKGIYNAMNKGIKLSQGDLIGLINSDDWYLENTVETVVEKYLTNSKANVIITGAMCRTDSQGNVIFKITKSASFLHQKINRDMPVNHPATFVNQQVYAEIGLFDEQYKIAGDYDFIYRAYYSGQVKFVVVDDCLACMRLDGLSEKVGSFWVRTCENYLLRSKHLHSIENLYISISILLLNVTKTLIKPFLGKSLLSIYYGYRHG